jgi:hypothetical protein
MVANRTTVILTLLSGGYTYLQHGHFNPSPCYFNLTMRLASSPLMHLLSLVAIYTDGLAYFEHAWVSAMHHEFDPIWLR